MTSNQVLSEVEYDVVGKRPVRPDGVDKVTGRAKYGGDFQMSGLLHGHVLRSPHAHARIKSIDVSRALAYPGVRALVTGQDMPVARMKDPDRSQRFASDNLLARDKVLYKGHAVAAVSATSLHIAEEALSLIEVDYELLPPVIDVLLAMKDDAPLLDENRYLVQEGLRELAKTRRPGLRALYSSARVDPDEITAETVSFQIAPRLTHSVIVPRSRPGRSIVNTILLL